ncbi:MAG: BlaI/MecI/CopY family transcriptional regulator [Planctomycetota bacterium]|nr:BlaI/MecI/CopY family transcriptional regulator [Planctomycetota bacterium]
MARPKTKELTERELEVMHAVWDLVGSRSDGTATTVADVREELARRGRDLAYTTVATLFSILAEKGFVTQTNDERPFRYVPAKSFEEVSGSLLGDLVDRVFSGSREQLLVRLVEDRKLTKKERSVLEDILKDAAKEARR